VNQRDVIRLMVHEFGFCVSTANLERFKSAFDHKYFISDRRKLNVNIFNVRNTKITKFKLTEEKNIIKYLEPITTSRSN